MTEEMDMSPIISGELQTIGETKEVTARLQEIQGAMFLARKFPRNYDTAWGRVMGACQRKTLAEKAEYRYPRGGKQVVGPSVYIARQLATCYGNIHYGFDIIERTDESVSLVAWCWDLETNTRVNLPVKFSILIQRKTKDGSTEWVKPDERDTSELINRNAAKAVRNCILSIIPSELTEDALGICRETLSKNIKDPAGEKKRLILGFSNYGVTPEMISRHLGTEEWLADHLVYLIGVLNSIKDGNSKPSDYFKGGKYQPENAEPEGLATGEMSLTDMAPSTNGRQEYTDPPKTGKKLKPEPEKKPDVEALRKELTDLLESNADVLGPELLEHYPVGRIKFWQADALQDAIAEVNKQLVAVGQPDDGDPGPELPL